MTAEGQLIGLENDFISFLKQFKDDQTAIGDLARDALNDPYIKNKRVSGYYMLEYLLSRPTTCPGAIQACKDAATLYGEPM